MGALRKRGGVWWVRYCRAGVRYEESSKSSKKEDAKTLLALREGAIAAGAPVTAAQARLTFDDAVKDVLTDYTINGKRSRHIVARYIELHLAPFFRGRRMASITTADVRQYIAYRQAMTKRIAPKRVRDGRGWRVIPEEQRPVSRAQINREVAVLRRAFVLAVQNGKLLTKPHCPMLREDNVRSGFFERDQFDAVCRHLKPAWRLPFRFAYITGWRVPSEVLPLQWHQVDFAAGTVTLLPHTTKNGRGRVFPFTAALRDVLDEAKQQRDALQARGVITPYVFQRNGRRMSHYWTNWNTACRKAGVPGRLAHDLRRTAIRNMVRSGIPERVSMQLSGHLTRTIFARYDIVSPGDLIDAAARLDSYQTGTKLGQTAV